MPKAWSNKRERQYEHIKEGYEHRGKSEDTAEEIAARTVNKERKEHGETQEQRAGADGGRQRKEPTRDELYQQAKRKNIEGRSSMNKDELKKAVEKA